MDFPTTLPTTLQDIDSSWLSEVLGASVAGFKILDAHAGTTGRGLIELVGSPSADLPKRLFVKLPPNDEAQRNFVSSSGMGVREVNFYRQLSAEVPVRVPRNYHAVSNDAGDQYIMLMEHLPDSGCSFRNAKTVYAAGESMPYIHRVLNALARLHGAYWNSPRFQQDLAWIEPPLQHDIAVGLVEIALRKHAQSMPQVFTQMAELYLSDAEGVHRLWRDGEPTLIHGDVHDGNLFLDGDEPGFLDWAVLARGPGMRDTGYFLAGTLEDRERSMLPELVRYYREQLMGQGVDAGSEQLLWQQLQWHAAYVWIGATVTLAMGDAWQPVNYVLSSLRKIHGALEHLHSVDAIKAAL